MRTTRLRDGSEIVIRPIAVSDAVALEHFHDSLSRESQRLRFFNIHPHLTATELERFTAVDHEDHEALVALRVDQIIGVGRFDRLDNRTEAEVTFVTRDDYQGLGIATILLRALADTARGAGIMSFHAETPPENHKMLDVFADSGIVSARRYGHDVVHITMRLSQGVLTQS